MKKSGSTGRQDRAEAWYRIMMGLAVTAVLGGCGGNSTDDAKDRPIRVVATSTMLADMVKALAGDDFEVVGLMAPGVDPHTYEMPARAVALIRGADVVIYNGHLLEGKMPDVLEPLAAQGKAVVAAAESLPAESLIHPAGFEGHADPHVWGDVKLWRQIIEPVREALEAMKPDRAESIRERAAAYGAELDSLDAWIRERIGGIPEGNRLLVTSHDAFNYFGRAYGMEVIGVQGISTASEAGIADIVGTVDLIRQRGVKAIFVESSVSRATIERISKDAGITIGGELFSDSCGAAGDLETADGETWDKGTYIGMMKHNVHAIAHALK
ncbi:MAG: zinc ABC transporter substrate-binding protein [Verrucomicrobiae bacterium]|nr:zinc ABC transporter substrate-binding protein [Verrucomicrobiae bacterium]